MNTRQSLESRYRPPVSTRALVFYLAVLLALGSALGTAGCGATCPASDPNCGSPNSSNAGTAGAAGSSSCDALTTLRSCFTAYCATTTNPFCNCYKKGFDLSTTDCPACITFDAAKFCADQAASGVTFDCSAATGAVGTACVGVQ